MTRFSYFFLPLVPFVRDLFPDWRCEGRFWLISEVFFDPVARVSRCAGFPLRSFPCDIALLRDG